MNVLIARIPINVQGSVVDLIQIMFFKGFLILLATALVVFLLRRSAAASRHFVWLAALASLVVLPFLPSLLPAFEIPIIPVWNSGVDGSIFDASRSIFASVSAMQLVKWLSLAWFAVAMLLVYRVIASHKSAHELFRNSDRLDDDDWHDLLEEKCDDLGISRLVKLRVNSQTSVPLTMGLRSFAIILPDSYREWTEEQRAAVLLHELAHIRRRDCLLQVVVDFAVALHWFNPLVWYAAAKARYERERAADDMVLGAGVRPSVYASALLDLVRDTHRDRPIAALAFSRKSDLEQRMKAILDPNLEFRSANWTSTAFAVIIVAGITLPFASLQPMETSVPQHAKAMFVTGNDVAVHSSHGETFVFASPNFTFSFDVDRPHTSWETEVRVHEEAKNRERLRRLKSDAQRARERARSLEKQIQSATRNFELVVPDDSFDDVDDALDNLVEDLNRAMSDVEQALGENVWISDAAMSKLRVHAGKLMANLSQNNHQVDWNRLRQHGVDHEYVVSLLERNFDQITTRDIIRLHEQCVDIDFIERVLESFPQVSFHEIAQLDENDVDEGWLMRIERLFGSDIQPNELTRLARFEIDNEMIESVDRIGFDDVTVEHLVTLASAGLGADDLYEYHEAGVSGLSLSDITRLARHGIAGCDIVEMRDAGVMTSVVDEIIDAYYVERES